MANNGSYDLGYDERELERELRSWCEREFDDGANDPFAQPRPAKGTIYDVVPAIDSLAAVTGLVIVEKHIGFELPPKAVGQIIRRGGYMGTDDIVNDILPKVRDVVVRLKAASVAVKEISNEGSTTRGTIGAENLEGNRPTAAGYAAEGSA